MIISKISTFSILLISSLTFAQIQLHTHAELKNSDVYGDHTVDVTCTLDTSAPVEIYNHNNIKMIAELLHEEESYATVSFDIYNKDAAGDYTKILNPVIAVDYTQPASLSTGSNNSEIFTMTVNADKV